MAFIFSVPVSNKKQAGPEKDSNLFSRENCVFYFPPSSAGSRAYLKILFRREISEFRAKIVKSEKEYR